MPSIVADPDAIRLLAAQVQAAADYAGDAAASVHSGLRLDDLAVAATLDPAGAVEFEAAAFAVLTGPFALAGIEGDLARLASSLRRAAEDYGEAELEVTAESRFGPVVDTVMALAALLPPDRTPTVVPVTPATGTTDAPPRDLDDLMSHLGQLDDTRRPGQGEIDIQTLTGVDPAGRAVRKIVVYLPGVDDWNPLDRNDVNDAVNAARPIEGESSTYEYGVLEALRQAGVAANDDVTIVAHSQGGAVAVNVARDAANSGQYNVTHVITAGAPIGIAARSLPVATTRVLALENRDDVIPRIDDAPNPVRPNLTTVTIDAPHASPLDNHDLDRSYIPASRSLESSTDLPVRSYLQSQAGLYDLGQSSTTRYSITGN
jgi:hypothetical protein